MEDIINIITLGNSGVGKTCILVRYAEGKFKDGYQVTHFDLIKKTILANGQSIAVKLWDTSGQERFRSVIRGFFRKADGLLLVYSVDNFESWRELESWLTDFRSVNDSAEIIVVGSKSDVPERSEEGIDIVRQLTKDQNLEHVEVSAKTDKNVNETVQYLIDKILVAKGLLDHYNRPDCITSSSSEETVSQPEELPLRMSSSKYALLFALAAQAASLD